jgi:hypothetical protein
MLNMALEPSSESPSAVVKTELKKEGIWHPHVYKAPPKSPTPFSIDDILKRGPQGNLLRDIDKKTVKRERIPTFERSCFCS